MAKKATALKGAGSIRRGSGRQTKRDPSLAAAAMRKTKSTGKSFPVCGIGASAGGLEAFTQLLRALPADTGIAFVLVQHLDPKHESLLTELLARATTMPVHEVEDGMAVEPNHIYVIPRNTNMMISGGVLRLTPRAEDHGKHMPVDFLFRSLAHDMGSRAIGVILSGSASDGMLGLKAIKAEGGITFAQDEKSAKYDSMPRAAVAGGGVDLVLPPEKIAAELLRIGRHPALIAARAAKTGVIVPETGNAFHRILSILHQTTGLDLTYYKHSTIKRRIARRMVMLTMPTIDGYVTHLQKHPAEAEALGRDILIHVTGFFRDPATFRALQSKIIPQILLGHLKGTPLRVWVPGCSTGEEAYSIAICLLEYLEEIKGAPQMQIFATDVSDVAIEKARLGIYPASGTADVSPERLRRFFAKLEGGSYQISKSIRDACILAKQDVTKDPPFSNIDLISCRNVLIYLGAVLQKKVLAFLHYALRPSGFLTLGSSESISGFSELFTPVDQKHKFYLKKSQSSRVYTDFVAAPYGLEKAGATAGKGALPRSLDLYKEIDRLLLRNYAPPAILINEKLDILQFRGRTSPYLEPMPGEASLNLARMAREGLMASLNTVLQQAKKGEVPVRKEGIRFQRNGGVREVNLEVTPFKSGKERYFLVLFEEREQPDPGTAPASPAAQKPGKQKKENQRVLRLQEELAATKEYLQSVIESQEVTNEELRSANEEIQSSNEELQSTNEELETAKEELQSTNEELTTLSDTLQNKNQELGRLNNDLTNLLASINVPIVMLSNDLRIRLFTPMAEKVLNLIPSDVGRPIGNIKPNILGPDLEHLIGEVLETLRVKEMEVQDRDGRWYSLRIRPYRTTENKIDGVVLTMFDIDALKTSLEQVMASRQYAEAIVDTVRQPLLVLDADLRVKQANPSFYRTFHTSREETENQFLYQWRNGQWNLPALRLLLQEVLPKDARFDDFEMECDLQPLGRRDLLLSGRRLETVDQTAHILLAIQDVTERHQAELRYRRLFETAKDGILIADAETGQITHLNPALVELLGYSRSELLLGREFGELLAEEDLHKWRAGLEELKAKGHVRLLDVRLQTKAGQQIEVECVGNIYLEGNKKVMQCNMRDITERKRSEDQIKNALREKEVLIKEIHHRVKNNLQIIHSLLNLQARYIKDQPILDLFRESQNRVKSMALIHEELYRSADLANIDFSEYLRKLTASLIRTYGVEADRVGVRIDAAGAQLGIDTAIPCGLLISELVSNSLKHAFPDGRTGEIRIQFRREGDGTYLLSVGDNGVGLPEGLDLRNTQSLGLQLVSTLSDQLGARVELNAAGGTEFSIRFTEPADSEKGPG